MSEPLTYTVEETSELLRLGLNQTYQGIARREIPSVKIGRRILVPRARLLALLGEPADPGSSEAGPASPASATTTNPVATTRKVYPNGAAGSA